MKDDEQEIQDARDQAAKLTREAGGDPYLNGIRDALEWILGDIEDEEMKEILKQD